MRKLSKLHASPCLGQIVLPVVVDKQQSLQNFLVADIQDEGIIGLDFWSENNDESLDKTSELPDYMAAVLEVSKTVE